jgi:hypothetical protein
MSTNDNNRDRRKAIFVLEDITTYILALTLLPSGSFVIIISLLPMNVAAFAQGDNNTNMTIPTPNNTPTPTTPSSSKIELSLQPVYQEQVRDVSEILINQTHAHLTVEGNGTLTLPNSTESTRTTSKGGGIVSIFSTFAGKEILTTEDGSENATTISYEIARSNKEQGIGRGVLIAIIHTNSTGILAPLDGMILIGQEEFQPDGRALVTYWEWQSGIPYAKLGLQPVMQGSQ